MKRGYWSKHPTNNDSLFPSYSKTLICFTRVDKTTSTMMQRQPPWRLIGVTNRWRRRRRRSVSKFRFFNTKNRTTQLFMGVCVCVYRYVYNTRKSPENRMEKSSFFYATNLYFTCKKCCSIPDNVTRNGNVPGTLYFTRLYPRNFSCIHIFLIFFAIS